MARSKLSVPRCISTGVTASSEESDSENLAGMEPPPPKKKTKVEIAPDAVPSAGLEDYNCETDEDTKKTKVEVVADAVPSAGLDEYGCETDEDTDHPTSTSKQSDIGEMREQLKELKKKLEEKDGIISQLNERISDLEQGNSSGKIAVVAKTDADDDVEVKCESKVEQPKEQPKKKSKQFQRQNGLMVWARDSDNPKAEHYLAYLDDVYDQDEGDHVWIRWDNDIRTAVRVHKSRIKDLEKVYKRIYAWYEGYGDGPEFYFFPYDRFIFWRKLVKCETWGEIRAIADETFCGRLKERYEERWEWEDDDVPDDKKHVNNLNDDTEISMDDFDLQEHHSYGDCTPYGSFPPLISEIMHTEADADTERHGWIIDHGYVTGTWYENIIEFDKTAKEAIFNEMRKAKGSGRAGQCAAIQCPELRGIFPSIWDF